MHYICICALNGVCYTYKLVDSGNALLNKLGNVVTEQLCSLRLSKSGYLAGLAVVRNKGGHFGCTYQHLMDSGTSCIACVVALGAAACVVYGNRLGDTHEVIFAIGGISGSLALCTEHLNKSLSAYSDKGGSDHVGSNTHIYQTGDS